MTTNMAIKEYTSYFFFNQMKLINQYIITNSIFDKKHLYIAANTFIEVLSDIIENNINVDKFTLALSIIKTCVMFCAIDDNEYNIYINEVKNVIGSKEIPFLTNIIANNVKYINEYVNCYIKHHPIKDNIDIHYCLTFNKHIMSQLEYEMLKHDQ